MRLRRRIFVLTLSTRAFVSSPIYRGLARTDLGTLTRQQAEHHHANIVGLNEYRLRRGQPPISGWEINDPWPVALQAET